MIEVYGGIARLVNLRRRYFIPLGLHVNMTI